MQAADRSEPAQGRYVVYGEIASGGMATVEYGRRVGPLGFARPVAIKRPHAQFLKDPVFVSMFVDEARLGARLQHANIVSILDLVDDGGRLALVMEYVHGETLDALLELAKARGEPVPVPIATALIAAVLHGLHAAHETRADGGALLGVVHRDVSPQNILVGADGAPRVLDFGIAKGAERMTATPSGTIKGKLLYMPPEQLRGEPVDRRADVFSASAVLWEALTGDALFDAPSESAVMHAVLERAIALPSTRRPDVPEALDRIVHRGLLRDAAARFGSARDMALALERDVGTATASDVSAWVLHLAGDRLVGRAAMLQRMQAAAEAQSAARVVSAAALEPPTAIASEVTGIQVASRRKRGRVLALAAIGIALIALLLWQLTRPTETPPAAQQTPPVAPRPLAPAVALEPVAAPAPAPIAQPEPSEPPPQRAPRPRHLPNADRSTADLARPPRTAAPAKPTAQCAQPYVIDAQGIRHPKPECL